MESILSLDNLQKNHEFIKKIDTIYDNYLKKNKFNRLFFLRTSHLSEREIYEIKRLENRINYNNKFYQTISEKLLTYLSCRNTVGCVKENQFYSIIQSKRFADKLKYKQNRILLDKRDDHFKVVILKSLENDVIIKTSISEYSIPEKGEYPLLNESYIGITGINPIIQYVPNFIRTYGIVNCGEPNIPDHLVISSVDSVIVNMCSKERPWDYLFLEMINGQTLFDILKTKEDFSDGIVYDIVSSVICQVILALYYSYKHIRFAHNDLHLSNIIIEIKDEPVDLVYRYNDEVSVFKTKYVARIIDYGRSNIVTSDGHYGFTDAYIDNENPNPLSDIYRLLREIIESFVENSRPRFKEAKIFLYYIISYLVFGDKIELELSKMNYIKTRLELTNILKQQIDNDDLFSQMIVHKMLESYYATVFSIFSLHHFIPDESINQEYSLLNMKKQFVDSIVDNSNFNMYEYKDNTPDLVTYIQNVTHEQSMREYSFKLFRRDMNNFQKTQILSSQNCESIYTQFFIRMANNDFNITPENCELLESGYFEELKNYSDKDNILVYDGNRYKLVLQDDTYICKTDELFERTIDSLLLPNIGLMIINGKLVSMQSGEEVKKIYVPLFSINIIVMWTYKNTIILVKEINGNHILPIID